MRFKKLATIVMVGLSFLCTQAQSDFALTQQVDSLFSEYDQLNTPGCAVAILKSGQPVYSKSFGAANLSDQVPITLKSSFSAASVTKQFTAAALGILLLEGKLNLEDSVQQFIPEFPSYQKPMKIKHLVYHTSGLNDYGDLRVLSGLNRRADLTNEEILELLGDQKSLNHPPGERFSYTNSGYILLAEIIERVTQTSLRSFARMKIFDPLGMDHTYFNDHYRAAPASLVISYTPGDQGTYLSYYKTSSNVGAGGLMTTLEDLMKWDMTYMETKLGYIGFNDLLKTGSTDTGEVVDYSFGLTVGNYHQHKTIEHGGTSLGFSHQIIELPDLEYKVILLSNLESFPATRMGNRILDVLLESSAPIPGTLPAIDHPTDFIKVQPKEDEALVGKYWNDAIGYSREIEFDGTNLVFRVNGEQAATLRKVADHQYYTSIFNAKRIVAFGQDQGTGERWMTISINDKPARKLYRYHQYTPDSVALRKFTGTYQSSELNVLYEISATASGLQLTCNYQDIATVEPVYQDYFRKPRGGIRTRFMRNENGEITGFYLSSRRASNIAFMRIDGGN